MRTYRTWMLFAPLKSRQRAKICVMGVSMHSDHIQIKIKMPNTKQKSSPSKSVKTVKIGNLGVSKTSDHIKIKVKMPDPSQEPPAPIKAHNKDLKDMDVLCTFKIKEESQNLEYGCTKDQ